MPEKPPDHPQTVEEAAGKIAELEARLRKTEAALATSEERLHLLLENANAAIVVAQDGRLKFFNTRALEATGRSAEEMCGRLFMDFIHPEDRLAIMAHRVNRLSGKAAPERYRFRFLQKDGSQRWVENRVVLIDWEGRPATLNFLTDITESWEGPRKTAEKYRQLVESASEAVAVVRDGRFRFVNQAMENLSRYTSEELKVIPVLDLVPPEDHQKLVDHYAGLMKGEPVAPSIETRVIPQAGPIRWMIFSLARIAWEGEDAALIYCTDITARKALEDELKDSETRYRALFERAGDAIFILEAEGEESGAIVNANPAAAEMHGYTVDRLKTMKITDLDAPDAAREAPMLIERIKQGEWIYREIQHQRADGTIFPMEVSAGLLELSGHNYILAFDRDITIRKQFEESLIQSEHRYRSLIDYVPYGIFVAEILSGRFIYQNPKILDMFGYSREEADSMSIWDVTDPNEHALIRERLEKRVKARDVPQPINIYNCRRKNGAFMRCEIAISLVPYENRLVIQGILRDITEQERMEKRLHQSQKMQALGTLTGGVAHEFNNLLMGIRGYTQLLATRVGDDITTSDFLAKIERVTERAAELTTTMLGFARQQSVERVSTRVNDLVENIAELLSHTLPQNIELRLDTARDLPLVLANGNQIEQVLLNLSVNARDAMPQGGRLTFRTRAVTESLEGLPGSTGIEIGPGVEVTVADTGQGMTPEVREHLFEPFFTTKGPGQGTGLGLAVVYSIVKNHDGLIMVESEPGQGSLFRVYLPTGYGAESELGPAQGVEKLPRGRGQRFLVVDDEEMVREIIRESLEAFGYQVAEAGTGEEALDLFEAALARGLPFDMILLDLAMPGLGGHECLRRMKARAPETQIIVATGFTEDQIAWDTLTTAPNGLLRKPFHLDDLLQEVHRVFSGGGPRVGQVRSSDQ